ncbi:MULTISPECIES: hypothetical protein [Streptomyces]|uniref:hypothetical protein n=1 Tax=Streptomyces TaxID=1883 RepID=UPI002E2D71B9|nr:hypothetical protein [Streptomyces sp. NBC_00258]WTA06799.1 hypothetical protein OHB08_33365 [Streptomyces phaeochromogenes]
MSRPQITLVDLYRDRPLTDAQARRIVALLGLAQPRHKNGRAGVAAPTPPAMPSQQQAS